MKKIALIAGVVVSLLLPVQAQAAHVKLIGVFSDIATNAATVPLLLSNAAPGTGYYIQECLEPLAGARPTICNNAAQLWISNSPGASFTLSSVILFKPTASFTSATRNVDCLISKCGIFLRLDHTKPADTSEDQFLPLSFKATSAPPVLASDVITATLNGTPLSTSTPFKLAYRAPAILVASSSSGVVLTSTSLTPECALADMKFTALKGTGLCNISISSVGVAGVAGAITMQYPIELSLGIQSIPMIKFNSQKRAKLIAATNFGEKVTYRVAGSCSLKQGVVTAKRGSCTIIANAPGGSGLYLPLNTRTTIKIK